jgi:Sigma-70, region 4
VHMVAIEGMRNAQIAEVFGVTESTVRNKLRRVFNVMCMDSRLQVATFVHRSPALLQLMPTARPLGIANNLLEALRAATGNGRVAAGQSAWPRWWAATHRRRSS